MNEILFMIGDLPVRAGVALVAFGTLALVLLLAIAVVIARSGRRGAEMAMAQAIRADELEERLAEVLRIQNEAAGRVPRDGAGTRRPAGGDGARGQRAARFGDPSGRPVHGQTTRNTMDSLRALHERLGISDNAHKNLTELTSQVNDAARRARQQAGARRVRPSADGGDRAGRPAEGRLCLPAHAFQQQAAGLRDLPARHGPLCIDAKFPLESVTALRDARSDEERKAATQRLRQDVMKHVADIADKYLVPGETQDTALMFVPSESVYAEIHDGFDDVVQRAYRARVVLVSPSLLMLAIQVMQQILKDARMRDAADQIRTEVMSMADDLARLRERVLKLQSHFGQVNEDVRQILISADKIEKRAGRIEELGFLLRRRGGRARRPPPLRTPSVRAATQPPQAASGGVALLPLNAQSFVRHGGLGPAIHVLASSSK